MFSDAEIADLRALEAMALPQTCTVSQTTGGGVDAFNRPTKGTGSTTTHRCRVAFSSSRLSGQDVRGGQVRPFGDAEITFAYGTDIRQGAIVTCEGRTYDVTGINEGRAYQTATVASVMLRGATTVTTP